MDNKCLLYIQNYVYYVVNMTTGFRVALETEIVFQFPNSVLE